MMIRFRLNQRWVECEAEPYETLLDVLRERLGVRSVKRGCNVGECGACTVLLDGEPGNSCLLLAPQVKGRSVETLEGLTEKPLMKELIEAFLEDGAIQCGYCTPGMLVSAYALLRAKPRPSEEEVKRAIVGNLCRCTGYVNIIKAIIDASRRLSVEGE
jgi:carbon-monoxide dehydrogenase small subunit